MAIRCAASPPDPRRKFRPEPTIGAVVIESGATDSAKKPIAISGMPAVSRPTAPIIASAM